MVFAPSANRLGHRFRSGGALRFLAISVLAWVSLLAAPSVVASTNDTTGTRVSVKMDADPINLAIGEYTFLETLSLFRGPFPIGFRLYYGSARNTKRRDDGLPFKFSHDLHGYLVHDTDAGTIALEPGLADEVAFRRVGDEWLVAGNEGVRLELRESGEFYYVCDPVAERVSIFRRSTVNGNEVTATLRARLDRNGNRALHVPSGDPSVPGPVQVQDTLGRSLDLTYEVVGTVDTRRFLTRVTDHGGRSWRFLYEENPPDGLGLVTLRALVDPAGGTNLFRYAGHGLHFVESVTLPRGNTPSRQTYRNTAPQDNFRGLVIGQTDALANRWEIRADLLDPENPLSRLTLIQPDGTRRGFLHDHAGRMLRRFVDEEGRAIEYDFEAERDHFTRVTDRRGHSSQPAYHPSGKISAFINGRGLQTSFSHTTRTQVMANPFIAETFPCVFHDLTRVDYPDGSFETFDYDDRGNVIESRDRAGATTRYGYNAAGQVTALTNALGGVTRFTYDAAGNLATLSDGDGVSWTFGYDALFRLSSITHADGSVIRHERDVLDLLTAVVDEHGVRTEFTYDGNRNLTRVIRAAGTSIAQTNSLGYDDMDRLVRLVDPVVFTTTLAHTYRGALAEATYADGASIRTGYDRRQLPVEFVDEAGKTIRVTRDGEGLPTFLLTAAGRRFRASFDPQGFPIELVDGLTNRFLLAYDPLQRITNVVDRLGRALGVRRDGEGRIASLELPIVGEVQYARNGLGQITNLTDFRGAIWRFQHTSMGRLAEVRDPLGNRWTFAYDQRGRLERVSAPDGVVETNRYDAVGSLVGRHFSDGLRLDYARDALRRITNTASVPVALAYDRRNLPVSSMLHGVTFHATHDSRGRLATLEYGGLSTITYSYDPRGLVTRVSDSRTGAFAAMMYDDDRFLRRIERSNGVHTDYERDANGAIVRIRHGDKADLRFSRNAGSEITRLASTGLLNVGAFLPDEMNSLAYDLANQPAAAGFSYDSRGRRTRDPRRTYVWDAANRLVSLIEGADTVTNTYTARGGVAVETVNGTATEFFYHDAVEGRPMLAERQAGIFRRYYVFTPSGALLFAVNLPANAPSFHHFDQAGTTVLLTDGQGAVTDTYGYTPYGRLVRHEGTSDQPFTFNGQFGVRQVGQGAVFHMRARFYDSLTGRFLSRDPSWLDLLESPTDLNPYGFARQNPVSFADPTGRKSLLIDEAGNVIDPTGFQPKVGQVVGAVQGDGSVHWQVGALDFEGTFDGRVVVVVALKDLEGQGPFQCVKLPGQPAGSQTAGRRLDAGLAAVLAKPEPPNLLQVIESFVPAQRDFLSMASSGKADLGMVIADADRRPRPATGRHVHTDFIRVDFEPDAKVACTETLLDGGGAASILNPGLRSASDALMRRLVPLLALGLVGALAVAGLRNRGYLR
jgi:RHS repeat-associated protein